MEKTRMVLALLCAAVLITACSVLTIKEKSPAGTDIPTATSHFLFRSDSNTSTPPSKSAISLSSVPTVAGIFRKPATATPSPEATATPTLNLAEVNILPTQFYTVTIYEDGLNPNWEVLKDTGVDFDLNNSVQVFRGRSAISFTPKFDFGSLFFTVSEKSRQTFTRDNVSRLSFYLYSGEEPLPLDQLMVTVVGSNSQPFWRVDDHSVTVDDQLPVFSATRLYYLGFNYTIPAQTWVPVELDLDSLIYDPDYEYVTGFYLKTEAGFTRTLWIDDIHLLMLEEKGGDAAVGATPSPGGSQAASNQKTVAVQIDTKQDVHPISDLIYGVSGASLEVLQALRPALNSWGGNPSTRYNWKLGNAWNAGSDWYYKNVTYGVEDGISASDGFANDVQAVGVEARLAVPMLGWVAKDRKSCSFPRPDGSCGDAEGATCEKPSIKADPNQANVISDPQSIVEWIKHLQSIGFQPRFIAMDNEPELWGYTHYDVHPACTTYEEILEKYLAYASKLRAVAKNAELGGPVLCCWYSYWKIAPGPTNPLSGKPKDYLPWFLTSVREHDEKTGIRTLDVLDVHYYPQGNIYSKAVDEYTAKKRLRSTRSLWDRTYVDESWINQPIYFIPRMKELIDQYYPGLKLGISEWNWGADETMNGALAIADVLGIFGREDLYYASYWQYPPLDSPGFFAFKMYTNFDDRGGRFGDTSVSAQSGDVDLLGSYAALESDTGDLHVMLVNKQVNGDLKAQLDLNGFVPDDSARLYRYDAANPEEITETTIDVADADFSITLPPYSITLLILPLK